MIASKVSRLSYAIGLSALLFALCATVNAQVVVLDATTSLNAADPTQLGRLSRNGLPQDWLNTEPFPGVINVTTTYRYRTFVVDAPTAALGPFMQVSIDSVSTNLFAAAYFTSYLPNSSLVGNLGFDTHWLGDAGASGGLETFRVQVPPGESLVVVVSTTTPTAGLGDEFHLVVRSFATPTSAVPEPSTYGLLGAVGLLGLSFWRRKRNRIYSPTLAP